MIVLPETFQLPARRRGYRIGAVAGRAILALCAILARPMAGAAAEAAAPQAASSRPATLQELMRSMADTPGVVAEFVETKHLALLDAPLETRGTLYFIPPKRLARHTVAPGRSTLIIDGDRLVFSDETGDQTLDLASNPIARVFVDNFIVLFNGDISELERRYEAHFAVDGGSWSLRLVPKRAPIDAAIASITMVGDSGGMRSMVMKETQGDFTETTFTKVDAAHRFSSSEIERIFRAPEPGKP